MEALEFAISIARLPDKEKTKEFFVKLGNSAMDMKTVAGIASDLETIHETLTRAKALLGGKGECSLHDHYLGDREYSDTCPKCEDKEAPDDPTDT